MTKSVKVYSSSTCPWCIRAKQFLKENNIEFQNLDVAGDQKAADEMMAKTGQMGVPVLDIDGEMVIGFDKEKIKQLLEI